MHRVQNLCKRCLLCVPLGLVLLLASEFEFVNEVTQHIVFVDLLHVHAKESKHKYTGSSKAREEGHDCEPSDLYRKEVPIFKLIQLLSRLTVDLNL